MNSFSIGWNHSWILFTLLFLLYIFPHIWSNVLSHQLNRTYSSTLPLSVMATLCWLNWQEFAVGSLKGPSEADCLEAENGYDKSFSSYSSALLKVKRCSTLPFKTITSESFPPFSAISSDSWLISCDTSVRLYQQMLAGCFRSTYVKITFRNDTRYMLEIT